jgi:hypothetical protein
MDTYYKAEGWIKFTEVDNYKDGCDPNTTQHQSGNDSFKGSTVQEVINKCMSFCGVTELDACLLDSCEEYGRLDIQTLETDDGITAYDRSIKLWKQGKLQLWACTYSFQIL